MSHTTTAEQVHHAITTILTARLPVAARGLAERLEQRLGANGLGFDSVTIVEVLLECEQHFDMPFPASLFDAGPLTIGRLVDHATAGIVARTQP